MIMTSRLPLIMSISLSNLYLIEVKFKLPITIRFKFLLRTSLIIPTGTRFGDLEGSSYLRSSDSAS